MLIKFNKKINVQSLVEQPEIYIVAQCNDNIEEKISYVTDRRDDAATLNEPIVVDNSKITDKMRFFIGKYFIDVNHDLV